MQRDRLDRRTWLLRACAAAAGAAMAGGSALKTPAATAAGARAPASAAGTIRLGGDIVVNRLGFGAMRITGDGIWGEPRDAREARAVLRRAVELGCNFIDTADAYGPAVSERLTAEALHPYPAGLVVATKGGMTRSGPNKWERDGRPAHLREACEASLRRLKVERFDVYQLHAIDPNVPMEDSVGELAKLQQEGKIRHLGVSNFSVAELERAAKLVRIVSVQNLYNVADRRSDDVLRWCETHGAAFIPWGPLARRQTTAAEPSGPVAALQAVATARGLSLPQATLAWLLARSPQMLPIPGTSRIVNLESNVAAAAVRFTPDEMRRIG
jgi:aryl-alcohol dehydrogenase-like predicted oxidoreductase